MFYGHGDDIHKYPDIRINFSSNVYNHFNQEGLKKHLMKHIGKISNYPEPLPTSLEKALAKDMDLKTAQVMVTNGATEAIYLIAQSFYGCNSIVLEPTFSEYADACLCHRHKVTLLHQMPTSTHYFDLCWICNPNNPTGIVVAKESLVNLINSNRGIIFVIDASYAPFTDQPVFSPQEAAKMKNVIMLHSMTKTFAIPGLRLGYAIANKKLLEKISTLRMPWSVNALAIEAGLYLLQHKEEYTIDIKHIIEERKRVAERLNSTGIVTVEPSDTHILLCKIKRGTATRLKEFLATHHKILIRDASNFNGLTNKHFRIAIQTPEENDKLIYAISQWG